MARGSRRNTTNDQVNPRDIHWFEFAHNAAFTQDVNFFMIAPFDGYFHEIGDIFMRAEVTGAAAGSGVQLQILVGTASILSEQPRLLATAANGSRTNVPGTGIREGTLLDEIASRDFAKGDLISLQLDEIGNSGATHIRIMIGLTPFQDFDPDITLKRE